MHHRSLQASLGCARCRHHGWKPAAFDCRISRHHGGHDSLSRLHRGRSHPSGRSGSLELLCTESAACVHRLCVRACAQLAPPRLLHARRVCKGRQTGPPCGGSSTSRHCVTRVMDVVRNSACPLRRMCVGRFGTVGTVGSERTSSPKDEYVFAVVYFGR